MEKEKIEKLILKTIKEESFEELVTKNYEIINFITGEIINDESFIINLRNELLKSKEDFNFDNPVITNLLLCVYSSALNICLNEIIKIKKRNCS